MHRSPLSHQIAANSSFHVYSALAVMLNLGLGRRMFFCAGCRFNHLSQLDAKNLLFSVVQEEFHDWFSAFQ